MDFGQVIQRAAGASLSSGRRSENHFVGVTEMVRHSGQLALRRRNVKCDGVTLVFPEHSVFPSHSSTDKTMVRPIAERLCRGSTLWLRDPLGKDRHFIPMRLDPAPIRSSAAQFLWINNG